MVAAREFAAMVFAVRQWAFVLTSILLACGGPASQELGEEGFETGPCIQSACLGGLVCLSDLCVVQPDVVLTSGEPPVDTTSTGSDEATGGTTGDPCPAPQLLCNDTCVDVAVDPDNCGGCASPVGDGQTCVDGVPTCGVGLTLCGDACADLNSSNEHCGGCDLACPSANYGIAPRPAACEPFGLSGTLTCTAAIALDVFVSCEEVCVAAGWNCADGLAVYEDAATGCMNTTVVSCLAVPVDVHESNGCVGDYSFVSCNCFAAPA
jgi:hypothetical protein